MVPTIDSTPVTVANVDVLYTYDVDASDGDGDTVTYVLLAQPLADFISVCGSGEHLGQLIHGWTIDVFGVLAVAFVVVLDVIGDSLGTDPNSVRYVLVEVLGAGEKACHYLLGL